MTEKQEMREKIKLMDGTFTAADFPFCGRASSNLSQLERDGEVILVTRLENQARGRPSKVYKRGNLRVKVEKVKKVRQSRPRKKRVRVRVGEGIPECLSGWDKLYPDHFTKPEFKVLNVTRVRNIKWME